jgi:hypothetical protein
MGSAERLNWDEGDHGGIIPYRRRRCTQPLTRPDSVRSVGGPFQPGPARVRVALVQVTFLTS